MIAAIHDEDRQGEKARIMAASTSPHMAKKVEEHEKTSAKLRKGLDASALHSDSAWWINHQYANPVHIARGLAGDSGFIKSQPKREGAK